MNYERIKAEDIQPGDRVARARTHTFHEVDYVKPNEKSITIRYTGTRYIDRPRRTAQWWVAR